MRNIRIAVVVLASMAAVVLSEMFIGAVLIGKDEPRLKVPPRLKVMTAAKTATDTNVGTKEPLPPLPETTTVVTKTPKVIYRSASSPRWNLSGSWSRVRNRADLINHLATTHEYSKATLNQMSLNQLFALHDDDHEGRSTLTKATKAVDDCPPGST